MSRSFTAALLAAALVGAPATALAAEPAADAQGAGAAADAQTTKSVGDPNRKICKKTDVTGYRLRKAKVCLTAAEWEARTFEDRQNTTRIQTRKPLDRS